MNYFFHLAKSHVFIFNLLAMIAKMFSNFCISGSTSMYSPTNSFIVNIKLKLEIGHLDNVLRVLIKGNC